MLAVGGQRAGIDRQQFADDLHVAAFERQRARRRVLIVEAELDFIDRIGRRRLVERRSPGVIEVAADGQMIAGDVIDERERSRADLMELVALVRIFG